MAFLDEDELDPGRPGPQRYGADRQRQILVRRLVALGAGILILILLLLGIRGCLDARKERGFENYVSDLVGIANNSKQLAEAFFNRFENPPRGGGELELQAAVATDRNSAETLLGRVQGLDVPDELEGAQGELVAAFELRRDALAGIADQIPTALGREGREEAIEAIAADMKTLVASDVLYARARAEIQQVLREEEISGNVPASPFVPEDQVEQWLDPLEISAALSGAAGDTGERGGVHGLAALSTTLNPGGVALTPDSLNTVTLEGTPELDVEVQNQGESEESEVIVQFSLTGGDETIEAETTIDRIAEGAVQTATLGFEADPPTGTELTLEVTVQPLPEEQIADNNTLTYQVIFE